MVACIKIPVDKLVAERRCPLLRSNTFTQELFIAIYQSEIMIGSDTLVCTVDICEELTYQWDRLRSLGVIWQTVQNQAAIIS